MHFNLISDVLRKEWKLRNLLDTNIELGNRVRKISKYRCEGFRNLFLIAPIQVVTFTKWHLIFDNFLIFYVNFNWALKKIFDLS